MMLNLARKVNKSYLYAFILAILLHAILLFCFIQWNRNSSPIGKQDILIHDKVYLYSEQKLEALPDQVPSIAHQVKQLHLSNETKAKIGKIKIAPKANSDYFVKIKNHNSLSHSLGKNLTAKAKHAANNLQGNNDKLLELLHNAISKAQFYPQTAQMLGQTGKVTVTFELDVQGYISNLRISVSSHFNLLDEAAIDAVKNIVPFVDAKNLLSQTKEFNITLVFHKIT